MARLAILILLALQAMHVARADSCLALAIKVPVCFNRCLTNFAKGCSPVDPACSCGINQAASGSVSSCASVSCGAETLASALVAQSNVCACAGSSAGSVLTTATASAGSGGIAAATSAPAASAAGAASTQALTPGAGTGASLPVATQQDSSDASGNQSESQQQSPSQSSGPRLAILLPAILAPIFFLTSTAALITFIILRRRNRRRQLHLMPSMTPGAQHQQVEEVKMTHSPYAMAPGQMSHPSSQGYSSATNRPELRGSDYTAPPSYAPQGQR